MMKLKDLLNEVEEFQQLPAQLKKSFLEIISTYGRHRDNITRKSDIRETAETLGAIADAAQEYTLREGDDWFDRVTIKRNMKELKALQAKFEKEAVDAKAQEQRLEALYEDMGHVLGRYFEIADVSEEVFKQRLGILENEEECLPCQQEAKKKELSESDEPNAFQKSLYNYKTDRVNKQKILSLLNKNKKNFIKKGTPAFEEDWWAATHEYVMDYQDDGVHDLKSLYADFEDYCSAAGYSK